MGFLYSETFLALMGLLLLDVTAGLALQGYGRIQLRHGDWPAADRWFRRRLAAPLPATRLLLDGFHGQRPWLQHERLRAMLSHGRFEAASALGQELLSSPSTPDWLKLVIAGEEAAQLGRAGHLGPARARLDDLLGRVPPQVAGLRAAVQSSRLPILLATGDWEEAGHAVKELEHAVLSESGGWPAHRLLLLHVRGEDKELLRTVRPLLEADPDPQVESEPEQVQAARSSSLLLAARAARHIGWTELQRDLVGRLVTLLPGMPPATRPVFLALQAVARAEAGDEPELDSLVAEVEQALAVIERAPGPTADAEGLLALAESRSGRHAAAIGRARGLVDSALSPLARWRAACRLGEVAEAAGDGDAALEAYRDALATGIESRRVPAIEERIAQLQSA